MIAWWGWLIIWTSLVLALLVMLGLFAWWLFRKFLVLTDDVGALAEKTEILDVEETVLTKPQLAVLADMRDIRSRENARKAHRIERKRLRRETRLARARTITKLDASATQWPENWYGK